MNASSVILTVRDLCDSCCNVKITGQQHLYIVMSSVDADFEFLECLSCV